MHLHIATLISLLAAAAGVHAQAKVTAGKGTFTVVEEGAEEGTPAPAGEEKQQIGDYIRDNSGGVQGCYAKALERRPTLAGKLVTRFDIGPSGKVIGATADGIPDKALLTCVAGEVRKWEFNKPASGGKLRVAYPYKLEPLPNR